MSTPVSTPSVQAVVARFLTLGGAAVVVKKVSATGRYDHEWRCEGCDAEGSAIDTDFHTKQGANKHAGECRAMPLT